MISIFGSACCGCLYQLIGILFQIVLNPLAPKSAEDSSLARGGNSDEGLTALIHKYWSVLHRRTLSDTRHPYPERRVYF